MRRLFCLPSSAPRLGDPRLTRLPPCTRVENYERSFGFADASKRHAQLRIGWTLIRLAHLLSKTNRPERTRRLLAVAESVCAKCLTLVEHDCNADRHGGDDHPNGQEEPKIEPRAAAVLLVDFRGQLFEVAAVLVTKKRDGVLLCFPKRHLVNSWGHGAGTPPACKAQIRIAGPGPLDNSGQVFDRGAGVRAGPKAIARRRRTTARTGQRETA